MAAVEEVHLDPALTKPDRIILQNLQADIDARSGSQGGQDVSDEKSDLKRRSAKATTGELFVPIISISGLIII